jgi:hypothetical protein
MTIPTPRTAKSPFDESSFTTDLVVATDGRGRMTSQFAGVSGLRKPRPRLLRQQVQQQ